ncbi:MAG: tetratricopeptide repeat protein, partial [Rhodospirillales bacterium]
IDASVAEFERMAQANPAVPEPLIALGNVMRGAERFSEAAEVLDRAVERLGEPRTDHWRVYYSRGIAFERSKQWDRAEKDFLKALDLEPEQPYVLNYLGYSWVDQGIHLERATEMIQQAVKLRPNDGAIVDSLGWALYRVGDFDGAVKQLERAVELMPHDPTINDHLGDAYWQVGRRHEARFQWQRALSLEPESDLVEIIEGKLKEGLKAGDKTGKDG